LHALTTLDEFEDLRQNTAEMALDWLAAGIRPQETIMFVQSHVPQVTELHTILSMFTPLGKLTDLPTFKEKVAQQPHNVNYGLVGYPVLMTADITLYRAGSCRWAWTRPATWSLRARSCAPSITAPRARRWLSRR
jgi:tryptophanyl-tRNA synthetase